MARANERILAQYGQGALMPFLDGPDKHQRRCAVSSLVVAGQYGRLVIALGDPVGPPAEQAQAWANFVDVCRVRGEIPAAYQASPASLGALAALDLSPFRIGAEAIIELADFDLRGSKRANLRHTIARARRDGVTFHFYPTGLSRTQEGELAPALSEIDRLWSAAAGPRLGFTIGQFDPATLTHTAIAIARDSTGAVLAFATFSPTGADGGWVLDLMRRAPGGTPGALEGALAEAAAGLRAAGATSLSLGLAPLAGLDDPEASFEERSLAWVAARVQRWYDVRGLAFFKGKFAPRWEPRYLATAHRRDLPALALALVALHLGSLRAGARQGLAALRPVHLWPPRGIS